MSARPLALALVGLLGPVWACASDDQGDQGVEGSTAVGDDSSEDTASPTETGEPGESETETGEPALTGTCQLGCSEPVDCCPAGTIGCPGDYPNDWSCEAGLCVPTGCPSDEGCQELLANPELECHAIAGVGSCFVPCTADGDCAAFPGGGCSGLADDGARFCEFPNPCQSDAECGGQGRCVVETGECRCASDADCSAPGLVCAE